MNCQFNDKAMVDKITVLAKKFNDNEHFESSSEYLALAELLIVLDDDGYTPTALAMIEMTKGNRDVLGLLIKIFDSNSLLSQFVVSVLVKEMESKHFDGFSTSKAFDETIRGNNMASFVLSHSFKLFGADFIASVITPLARKVVSNGSSSIYEVDPRELKGTDNIDNHHTNLIRLTSEVMDELMSNKEQFPEKLCCILRCIHMMLCENMGDEEALKLTGSLVLFLRYINPCLTNMEQRLGVSSSESDHRAFENVSKLLQAAANQQPVKQDYLRPFNNLVSHLQTDIVGLTRYLIHARK